MNKNFLILILFLFSFVFVLADESTEPISYLSETDISKIVSDNWTKVIYS
jgi:hypothetical protein